MLRLNNHLVVPAIINRKLIPLILDTGGAVNLLALPSAQQLMLKPVAGEHHAASGLLGVGGIRPVDVVRAETLSLGSVYAFDVPFAVPAANRFGAMDRVPDTLGMSFLTGFDVDVDMIGRRLVFFRSYGNCPSPHVFLSEPFYTVPEIPDPTDNRPLVTAEIHGQRFRALLDTGSPQSLLFRHAAENLGLSLAMHTPDARGAITGVGLRPVDVVRHLSEPIEVGDITISELRFDVSDEEDPRLDMILGMDFMSQVHFWISNSFHQIIMQVPPVASPPISQFHR
jgi:predicted aspartyl protease